MLCGEERSGGRDEIDDLEKIINKTIGKNIDKATKKTINKTVQKNKTTGSTINDKITGNINNKTIKDFGKNSAKNFPHSMGEWSKASQSHADYMRGGDFYSAEQSVTVDGQVERSQGTACRQSDGTWQVVS